jgi:hypothetical protein
MKARRETSCAREAGACTHLRILALRCAGWICRGALSLSVCLSFHPSIRPSISFLSSTGAQVVISPPLPSPPLSCPALRCPALHCTALYLLPLPSPLNPPHTTPHHGKRSTLLPCMQHHPSRGTSPVAAACTCTCTHTHTCRRAMQPYPTRQRQHWHPEGRRRRCRQRERCRDGWRL